VYSRDRIAADNNIGTGTASNIIDEWKKGLADSEYENVRELAVFSKKQGLNLSEHISSIRNMDKSTGPSYPLLRLAIPAYRVEVELDQDS
jgi:hypothetical protein